MTGQSAEGIAHGAWRIGKYMGIRKKMGDR